MASWQATDAKARFSALLDAAATEGPQVVRRRKRTFIVTTEEEFEKRVAEASPVKPKKFISAWEALRPSFDERYDLELPKREWKSRPADLG